MSIMLPIREVKPKKARTKRYLDNKAPQIVENARNTLFLRYTSSSEVLNLVLADLASLKKPYAIKFSKPNAVRPFEDASSLEFFGEKNDASLLVFASNSKKRPHCLTLVRLFDYKVLDMLELLIDANSMRTLQQFKTSRAAAAGSKPLLSFSGSAFESPVANAYTLAKSLFLELFKGPDAQNIDVEGLQYMIHFSVDEETTTEGGGDGTSKPMIHMRCYMLRTKKTATNLPRVELEEMGPRIDFRVGRVRDADPAMWKEAMKRPKGQEAKTKKNIETDIMGDKTGRIHIGRQDLTQLQTRKMKGLKRGADEDVFGAVDDEVMYDPGKRVKVVAV